MPVGTDAQMIKDALNIAFDSKILLKEQPHDIAMHILLTKVALKAENRRERGGTTHTVEQVIATA